MPSSDVPAAPSANPNAAADAHGASLLAAVPWGVLLLAPDGTVTQLNAAAEALWGVPAAAVLGLRPEAVQPPVLPAELLQALAAPAAEPTEYWLPHTGQWLSLRTAPAPEGQRWVFWDNVTARKHAEDAEQRSHELLLAVEEVARTGSYEADLTTGTFYFSDGMYRLFAEAPQSFVPTLDFIDARSHPADAARVRQVLDEARRTRQPYTYHRRIYWPGGEERTLEAHGNVVRDAEGTPVMLRGLVQDVTERVRAEQQRRASHELLQRTIDSSLDLVQVFEAVRDAQGAVVDFTWVLNNAAVQRVFGNVIGQRLCQLNPGVIEEGVFATFKRVLETGVPDQSELHYVHEQFDGWFVQSVVKLGDGVATTTHDLTARKAAEQEILRLKDELAQQALDRYYSLFRTMGEGVSILEIIYDADGRPVDLRWEEVNPAFERLTGLRNVAGQLTSSLVPTEPYWLEAYDRVVKTGEPLRYENYHAGMKQWYRTHTSRIGGPDSRLVANVFEDVTEHKRREAHLAFMAGLMSDFAPLSTVGEVMELAGQRLTEYLQLSNCFFVAVDAEAGECTVLHHSRPAGLPAMTGTYLLDDFHTPAENQRLAAGQAMIVSDVDDGHRTSAQAAAYRALDIRALVNTPHVAEGRWVFDLGVCRPQPGAWEPDEIELLQDVAGRVWLRLERAGAEDALRASEKRLAEELEDAQKLQAISSSLIEEDNVQALYEQILEAAIALLDAQMGSMQVLLAETNELELLAWRGFDPDSARFWHRVRADSASTCGVALQTHQRVLVPDVETCEFMGGTEDLASYRLSGIRAVQTTPLISRSGQLVGMISTHWTTETHPSERQLNLLDVLARQAADLLERKMAEEALQASEVKYRTLFETMEQGFGIGEVLPADEATGRPLDWQWLEVNPQFERLTGLSRPAVLDQTTRQLVPGLEEIWYERYAHVAATGETVSFESYSPVLDSWFDVYAFALGTPATRRVAVLFTNTTERRRAEATLREAEARHREQLEQQVAERTRELQASRDLLQSVFDTNLIAMSVQEAVRDETGAIQDFRLVLVSQELARETGRTDLEGKLYAQEYPGIREAGIFDLAVRALETGEPQHREYYYPHEGFDKWYACQFVKLGDGVVATNLDITERKTAEQERLKNLRLLEQAEAVAGLGSWDYDLTTGTMHWSTGMYQLLGLPLGQPVSPDLYLRFVAEEDRPRAEQLVHCIATGQGNVEGTLRLRLGGQAKTVRIRAVVLHDEAGRPVRVLGVDLDISELQRLEADNLRLRLTQQQQLFNAVLEAQETERQRIAEGLHNGVGQVLYATKLQLDQVRAADAGWQRTSELLAEAIRQTRAISHELVPMILKEYGLEPALRDICRKLSSRQLRFECHVDLEELPHPLPHPLQVAVYRMAQELGQNVIKHARASEASLTLEAVPGFVLLRAEDNGVGFAAGTVREPGLGLRSIRDRVELLGGQMEMGSAAGVGTFVRIRVPLPAAT